MAFDAFWQRSETNTVSNRTTEEDKSQGEHISENIWLYVCNMVATKTIQ
jgi:hypothetical protein